MIPIQLEIFILQYIGWCVLIIWTFIVNQFSCFCQFQFIVGVVIIIMLIMIIVMIALIYWVKAQVFKDKHRNSFSC